jgi:D-hexose-6-phosphate mutarotase
VTQTLDALNARFAISGHVSFSESGPGLPVADIHTLHASARVALQGAQVLAWQPTGQQPVIWVSKAAVYEPGKGVRGGVPVCWPWFGGRDGLPAHGFVRTRLWEVRETTLDAAGQVVLRLGMADDASTRALWDFAFDLELVVTVGQTLRMALVTRNTGTAAFTITDALHTYFCVGDIAQTTVQGLDGCAYLDKVQNSAQLRQAGAVGFTGETDRIYTDTTADCLIDDKAWGRSIRVAKQGSTSTVVWNPWSEREKAFADMAAGEYKDMLCVETCNAGPDQVTLAAGGLHTLSAMISVV